jgi:hypothetical protein
MTDGTAPAPRLSRGEFIALMGMIFATVAFSIDAMLPALPEIADALTPDDPNLAQLVLTSFVLGLGIGTLFTGPLSDSFGRKPVIMAGAVLYVVGAVLAWVAPSLELLLAARILQGLGAAGPRVVATAIIRDLYSGRQMAQIVSFAMLIFTIFPAVAPMIGAVIIWGFGWRAIFLAFLIFSGLSVGWLLLRQPETLPPELRRPFRAGLLLEAFRETLALRQMQLSILVQTLIFGALFATHLVDPPDLRRDLRPGGKFCLLVRPDRAGRGPGRSDQRISRRAAGDAPAGGDGLGRADVRLDPDAGGAGADRAGSGRLLGLFRLVVQRLRAGGVHHRQSQRAGARASWAMSRAWRPRSWGRWRPWAARRWGRSSGSFSTARPCP